MQSHSYFLVTFNNMMIRNHMSLFRDNHTGSETRRDAVAFVNPPAIAINDTLTLQNFGIDTDHGWCYSVDNFHHFVIGSD